MNRIFTRLGFTAVAIVAGSGIIAHAQTVTTGGVTGVVTDSKGAPIAGATVVLSSTQTTRQAVTGADGAFRMGLLNPGSWTISVTKSGLQKFSQNVAVPVNQTIPVNIKMAGEAQTVVEVIAASASIDTTTAQTGMTATMESLSAVPLGRDFNSILTLAPGAGDSGRLTNNGATSYSIAGASGIENEFVIDGLSTTDRRKGYQGSVMPTDFIDQVEIQTGGLKPEYSALGGVVNAVTKSGSNTFEGTAWLTFDARGIQAVPKVGIAARQASPRNRYDVGFTASGAILKDKLFYFVGLDYQKTEDGPSASSVNNLGLSNSKATGDDTNVYGKINWFIAADHQLTLAAQSRKNKDGLDKQYNLYGDANIATKSTNDITNWTVNYDWNISPSMILSAKVGQAKFENPTAAMGDTSTDNVSDSAAFANWKTGTGIANTVPSKAYIYGGQGQWASVNTNKIDQAKIDFSWFIGNHNIKLGYNQAKNTFTNITKQSGSGYTWQIASADGINVDNIVGTYYFNDGKVTGEYKGYYLQDTWEILPGFRAVYGGRVDSAKVKNYADVVVYDFHDFKDQFQPRLSFIYDLNNDGKSKFSLGYAKMVEVPSMDGVMREGGTEVFYANTYDTLNGTNPLAGNFTYDKTNGHFTVSGKPGFQDNSGAFASPAIADNTKLNTRIEWVAGYDQALPDNWNVGIHAKYRYLQYAMEDSVLSDAKGLNPDKTDPNFGPNGWIQGAAGGGGYAILWNPGSYVKFTKADGTVIEANTAYPRVVNKYTSLDITADHKTAHSQISFNYTMSRQEGNYEGMGQSTNGQDEANITSTFDYVPYVGFGTLPLDRPNIAKLFGSYSWDIGPGSLTLGGSWVFQSGLSITAMDDGSLTNGFAPGFDKANYVYLASGQSLVLNGTKAAGLLDATGASKTTAFDKASNTWIGNGTYAATATGLSAFLKTQGVSTVLHQYLDYGNYTRSIPNKGVYGADGRTPDFNMVNINLNYRWKVGKMRFAPSVDIFNLFNNRVTTIQEGRALTSAGAANPNFQQALGWNVGRRYRFGFKVQF
jgi:hypothetical protein